MPGKKATTVRPSSGWLTLIVQPKQSEKKPWEETKTTNWKKVKVETIVRQLLIQGSSWPESPSLILTNKSNMFFALFTPFFFSFSRLNFSEILGEFTQH